MKAVVAFVMDHACSALDVIGGGCWLLNESPLRRVWWWSMEVPR